MDRKSSLRPSQESANSSCLQSVKYGPHPRWLLHLDARNVSVTSMNGAPKWSLPTRFPPKIVYCCLNLSVRGRVTFIVLVAISYNTWVDPVCFEVPALP